jgi:hypothetical protein
MDVDQPEDEAVVRQTPVLNSLRYFVPETLGFWVFVLLAVAVDDEVNTHLGNPGSGLVN